MAVSPDEAWSVPGTATQPPRVTGRPNPYSQAILAGRWDVSDAQDAMLDAFRDKYKLHDMEWRPHKRKQQ
jgi:ribonuclease Z